MCDETAKTRAIGDKACNWSEESLRALGELGPRLLRAQTLPEIAASAVRVTRSVLERPLVGVWIYDVDADLFPPCETTAEASDLLGDPPVIAGNPPMWQAYETGDIYAAADITRDGGSATPIRSELVVPFDDRGVLLAGSTEPREFETEDLTFATALQAMVSTAMDRVARDERSSELEARNQRLALLADILSHDLQNPLMVAREYAVLAYETGDEEYLDRSDTAICRARTVIDGLLGLAITGQGPRGITDVSIASAAHDVWESTKPGSATLTVESDRVVDGDPRLVRQLLEQAFDNAIEHGPEGVSVRVDTHESGFSIEDDGPGIAREKREELLSDSAVTSEHVHIGFTIIRDVVAAHDWQLTLADAESGGTCLEITTA